MRSQRTVTVTLALTLYLLFGLSPNVAGEASLSAESPEITFVDVDQGDGVIIKLGGKVIVSDAGENFAGPRMAEALRRIGAARIDVAILSHAHDDHVAGFLHLLDQFPVKSAIAAHNDNYAATKTNRALIKSLKAHDVPVRWVTEGARFSWGGARWEILGPPAGHFKKKADAGNASVVYRLVAGSHSALFTGDLEHPGTEALVRRWKFGPADIFLVTHHGSKHGSSAELLRRIDPRYSVVSVGGNGYGHPAKETLTRLRDAGSTIWCTDVNGSVTATLGAGSIKWRTTAQKAPWYARGKKKGSCVGR